MRLEREHAADHAALPGFVVEQGQHGLVTAVYAVKIANRERTCVGHTGMVQAVKDLHRNAFLLIADSARTETRDANLSR